MTILDIFGYEHGLEEGGILLLNTLGCHLPILIFSGEGTVLLDSTSSCWMCVDVSHMARLIEIGLRRSQLLSIFSWEPAL